MIEMVRKIGNGVLTDRCARWWDEMGVSDAHTTFGAEGNPTGNPIGGGKGYSDILEGGDVTVRTYEELRAALEEAGTGQVIF
ncbi:MAG: hypothetical protein O2954_07170, partial [bacterium]|nr:hypothetical protein [bacterium]